MGTVRKSRLAWLTRAVVASLLLATTTASAQESTGPTCDPNLQPFQESPDQKTVREACETHIGCRLVFSYFRVTCKAADFVRKLADTLTPGKPVDNSAVADAATPPYRSSPVADLELQITRGAVEFQSTYSMRPQTVTLADGRTLHAELGNAPNSTTRYGTVIYSDGTISRGSYEPNGNIAAGQIIMGDGTMKVGTFERGQLHSNRQSSMSLFQESGRTVVLEGNYDRDVPIGEMVRRYADGSSVRERWQGGMMVERGQVGPPGTVPPPLTAMRVAPIRTVQAYPPYDGIVEVADPDGRLRNERWCQGRLQWWSEWAPKGRSAFPLRNTECPKPPEPEQTDEDEFEVADNDSNVPAESNSINGRPAAIAQGLPIDALYIQGPSWPCPAEIDAYLISRPSVPRLSPERFWAEFSFRPVNLLITTLTGSSVTPDLYQQFAAGDPGLPSQPVAFNMNGLEYREGFFRNRQAMLGLSAALESARQREIQGGEVDTLIGLHACVARYLASNARK